MIDTGCVLWKPFLEGKLTGSKDVKCLQLSAVHGTKWF